MAVHILASTVRLSTRLQPWLAVFALSLASPGLAQQAPAPAERAARIELEEIIVTGSRLPRREEIAPTPVIGIDAEEIELSGVTNLGEIVDELPALALGLNRTSNFGIGAADSLGANLLNLRGLGTDRTLVLVDGRRQVGAIRGTTAVDVNSIPVALIDRIEVSTGGASVAYGADAVAGVINVTLKRDFSGIEADVRGGAAGEGDAEDYYVSLTGGGNFLEERGNAVLNLTFNRQRGVEGRDRNWLARQVVPVPNPADTGPGDGIPAQILAENGRIPFTTYNGIMAGALTGFLNGPMLEFNPDGSVRSFDVGQPTGGSFNIGGDGLDLTDTLTIAAPLERILVNARVNYALVPNVRLFLDAKFQRTEASITSQPTGDFFTHANDGDFFLLAPDNPFLPFDDPQFAAFFAANPGDIGGVEILPGSLGRSTVLLSRFHADLGKRATDVDRDILSLLAGLEGALPGTRFVWDAFYQYGESQESRTDRNNRHERRFRLATDVTTDASGQPACRATAQATGPTFDPDVDNCLPLNIYGSGIFDPAARDFVMVDLVSQSQITQHLAGAVLRGELFDLPAGAVSVAGGAEYRRETSDFQPDPLSVQGVVFEGQTLPVRGKYEVIEGFAEASVPLLSDLPGAQALSVEGGVRFSDYDTVGKTTSWRAGLQWAPIQDIRLRAGIAEAVRAPNIGELFSPVQPGFANFNDPCDKDNVNLGPNPEQRLANCTAELASLGLNPATFDDPLTAVSKEVIVGGNPDLLEETAETLTVGLVFMPRFATSFTATVDFFDIEIEQAIAVPQIDQIVESCYDRFSSTDNEFCGLFERTSSGALLGAIRDVRATQLNIAALQVRGTDFAVRYRLNTPWLSGGSLGFALVGTYIDLSNFVAASDAAQIDKSAGEISVPRLRGNLDTVFQAGPLTASWRLRYRGEGRVDVQADPEQLSPDSVGSHVISDVQLRYAFGQQAATEASTGIDVYVGVNNLFDKDPPALTRAVTTAPDLNAPYDPIGRFFYAGIRSRF